MAERRRAVGASRDGSEKKKASGSDHEQDSDFVEGPNWQESEAVKHKVKDEPIRKIKLTKLPEETTEEILMNYFENRRRNGGGPIENIEYHLATSSAIIQFQEADAVDIVLKKRPLLFLQRQISVEEYVDEVEKEPPCSTIEVRGLTEVLEMYFENSKQSGGGEVTRVELKDGVALVTFADDGVASSVCKREHTFGGCKLSVSLHLPMKKSSAMGTEEEKEKEVEPVCTIEVRGYRMGLEGTIEMYFENTRRSGGGEIVKFDPVDCEGVIFITFASEEVAQRVASYGQHKVEGQPLEVKLYIPPPPRPTYTNRVLLAGLTSRVTCDGLTNFLEAKIGLTPDTFLYGEEGDKVIITFDEMVDFQKLEEACKKRALEGSRLQPSKVPVSNCILVLNLKNTTTEETIELYFENEKRSWGGPVKKLEFHRDEEYCLVYFEDHAICDRVLQRKHKIDGSDLQASMYYECLGRTSEYDNGPSFKPPRPLKLEGLEFAKIQFMMKSELNRTALEKQLQDCFTQIQWPQRETDCTTLTCTLTSDVQDCRKKALIWAKQAEQNLHDFLKVISVHNLDVFQEIFETVLQNLQNLVISNPDVVALFVKKAEFSVQVVGHRAVATVVAKDIEDIIKKAEADFDRKKKQTKESLTNLKYHQLKLLLAQKYPSKMEQKFNGLKVKINQNKNEIVFEGLMEDIRIAKVVMYETIHNAAVSQLKNLSEGRLFLYKSKEVKDYIIAKLKSNKLVGVWNVEGSNLNVYADSDEAVVQSAHIINDSVKEHQKDLQAHQRSVVQSQQWNDKMKALDKQYQGKFNVVLAPDFSKLCLYFTDDIFGAIMEEVTDFLSQNTVLEKLVTCNSGIVELIERKNKDELDKIAKDMAHYYVQITIQSKGGFLVQGNQQGISQAANRLQELVNKVKHRDHELKKPGIAQYMESKGREHISTVENQIPCVIQLKGQEQYGLGKNDEETDRFGVVNMGKSGPVIQAECKSYGGEKILTALGDITEIDADVLVNSADPKLEHRGVLAKAIVDKGGRVIIEECIQHVRRNGHLSEGEIHVTSAGSLQAKIIIHAVSPVWKGGHSNEEEVLRETIFRCMETVAIKGFKSIAISALGSGIFGCPVQQSTVVIVDAVRDFFRGNQDSSISEVYLCDINPQTVRYFTEALQDSFGKQCVKEVMQRPTPSPRSMKESQPPGAIADHCIDEFVDTAQKQRHSATPLEFWGRLKFITEDGSQDQAPRKVPLKSPQMMRPVEQTPTVWIDVYAWDKQSLDAAIIKLDHLIKNDFNKTEITDSVIKNFSPDQISNLQRLAQQWEIQLTVDLKIGRITIEGVSDGIMKVLKVIREADKKEQDKRSAELMKKLVQWHYIETTSDNSQLREYPPDVNLLIENAYKDQKPFVTFFTRDGEELKIDFSKMEEFPVKDPYDTVTVVRKDLIQDYPNFAAEVAVVEAPLTWTKMSPNENLRAVMLQSTDKEYQDVQQKFLLSVGGSRTILKLERIQNRTLYQQYEARKKLIELNNPGHQNENSLWHGTPADSVDSISISGFNRSYCGKNATAFGDGVYFAKNASYSASDTYSRPDPSGKKKMYLCHVLTGKYTTGRPGIRFPPPKSSSYPNDLYDSVVDNTSNPSIFVIFSDTQAIPDYLITFR